MKITQAPAVPAFQPITVVIETAGEAAILHCLIGPTSPFSRIAGANKEFPAVTTTMTDSSALSRLYSTIDNSLR